jgi:uncharacterized protein YecT (DUF1311 family)
MSKTYTFLWRPLIAVLIASQPALAAQQSQRPKKVLTPEQAAYQQKMKTYDAEFFRLRGVANSAFAAEAAREKAEECPNAKTTIAIDQCVANEHGLTEANSNTFIASLRAMLALPMPNMSTDGNSASQPGDSAMPKSPTAAFDAADAAWQTYAKAECDAPEYAGTSASYMYVECTIRLMRSRMHELDEAYYGKLHR